MLSVLRSALGYARRGLPVFPLAAGTNVPHKGSHGSRDATMDQATIRHWWQEQPDSNVAVCTGHAANLFVLDVDQQHGGHATLAELEAKHGRLPATPSVITPGGGRHYWFCWPATASDIRNSNGRVGPGLDIKANRGSITAPPSIRDGRRYEWAANSPRVRSAPPEWLVRLAMPLERPVVAVSEPVRNVSAYVRRVLEEELALLASATNGRRNAALNICAWNIGKLVKARQIDEREAFGAIMTKALETGLGFEEAQYTIRRTLLQRLAV